MVSLGGAGVVMVVGGNRERKKRLQGRGREEKKRKEQNIPHTPFQGIICNLKLTWGVKEQWC